MQKFSILHTGSPVPGDLLLERNDLVHFPSLICFLLEVFHAYLIVKINHPYLLVYSVAYCAFPK